MQYVRRNRAGLGSLLVLMVGLALVAGPAWAQYWRRQDNSALGLSLAYGSHNKGARLEHIAGAVVYNGGYFDLDDAADTKVYALELGWRGETERGASDSPYALGLGYYYEKPKIGDRDGDVCRWAGMGNFSTQDKGLFYQLRYIFTGPLKGTQGCLGYKFK